MLNFSTRQLAVSGVIVGLSLLSTIGLSIRSGVFGQQRPGITISEPAEHPQVHVKSHQQVAASAPAPTEGLCVHVAGKVKSPGVYYLKPGSRVNDAVKAAGGGLPNADLESINLAQKLDDGEQVFVAPIGKAAPVTVSTVTGTRSATVGTHTARRSSGEPSGERRTDVKKLTKPGKEAININTADANGLERLPGIGPAMAQRVLEYRKQNGRFKSIEELQEVRGIGPVKFERLRAFVQL
jgi:competence protein ComEA